MIWIIIVGYIIVATFTYRWIGRYQDKCVREGRPLLFWPLYWIMALMVVLERWSSTQHSQLVQAAQRRRKLLREAERMLEK